MCNVCCKEFRGWCRAFTATEVVLSVLQAILLIVLFSFLTFLILHLIACSGNEASVQKAKRPEILDPVHSPTIFNQTKDATVSPDTAGKHTTVPPDIACTWTPSAKTQAVTQYFEQDDNPISPTEVTKYPLVTVLPTDQFSTIEHGVFDSNQFNGEPADDKKDFIMALVKMRPPDDITFGCILTIVSEFWTLTAASCVESIEEIDSLDSYVMMENFGEPRHGRIHTVSDVLIHPQYQGTNTTYDIVALKSEDQLTSADKLLKLPTMIDYLLIAIGERLTVLGFGKFRSIDKDAFSRGAHEAAVHALPGAECAPRLDAVSARHLAGGAAVRREACARGALCAGPLYARGAPCNYCAGTPLVRARVLLGVMSAPGPCGAPCEPALYANLAARAVRDWLHAVLAGQLLR